jgi:tRNA-guanine transglycosylase
MFRFLLEKKDKLSKARAGILKTPHGNIETPCFIPVGTQATVKTLAANDLKDIGAQIVLGNTYHLSLRPGVEVVKKMGGLAAFQGWQGPTMTDSGGFQVFSLGVAAKYARREGGKLSPVTGKLGKFSKHSEFIPERDLEYGKDTEFVLQMKRRSQKVKPARIDDDGVTFYSHIDGSQQRLDPKISVELQEALGADLVVQFDDHESPLWSYEETKKSLERTNRWGVASLASKKRTDQLMYGVTHGGIFEDLRVKSAKFIDQHFAAIAIGGAYTSKDVLYKVIDLSVPYFTEDKPRHLLGIGEIADIFEAIERGMDFFDCVAPTRRGRHGTLYVFPQNGGRKENNFCINIFNAKYQFDQNPINPGCECLTCQHYTRSYIRHLFVADELTAQRLGSYHNVYFVINLVKMIRESILEGRFEEIKREWLK